MDEHCRAHTNRRHRYAPTNVVERVYERGGLSEGRLIGSVLFMLQNTLHFDDLFQDVG